MKRIVHDNGVISYTFDSTEGFPMRAHVSTRHGGVSPEPWRSLNFSTSRGDTPERVQENRTRFAEAIGIDADQIVRCRQVHGTAVAKVDWSDAGSLQDGVDALVTDAPGLPLALVFADCVPVLLYDPVNRALGVCHAGWRGTVNGAVVATLWAMEAAYSTEPADVVACIGPSIGPSSYEVGDEVVSMVEAKLPNAAALFSYPNGRENRAYFDLWQANASQLVDAGIPAAQIEISGIDTATHTDDFYSHRAEQGRCGLFTMIAWLTAD